MMKRFIIRAAALLLIFAALIYAAGALYRGTDGWAGLEATEETYKFHDVPDGITLAAAGSSPFKRRFSSISRRMRRSSARRATRCTISGRWPVRRAAASSRRWTRSTRG